MKRDSVTESRFACPDHGQWDAVAAPVAARTGADRRAAPAAVGEGGIAVESVHEVLKTYV